MVEAGNDIWIPAMSHRRIHQRSNSRLGGATVNACAIAWKLSAPRSGTRVIGFAENGLVSKGGKQRRVLLATTDEPLCCDI
jgi:hypothetical protein